MTASTSSSRPDGTAADTPSLESFANAASQGEAVCAEHDGSHWLVAAVGEGERCSGTDAQVLAKADTTSLFLEALEAAYTKGIRDAVVKTLELLPSPGQPLASRAVHQAVEMANSIRQSLAGVDFLTTLTYSAKLNSGLFLSVCRDEGVDPSTLGAAQRAQIDDTMTQRFAEAARLGIIPVAQTAARAWLAQAVRSVI